MQNSETIRPGLNETIDDKFLAEIPSATIRTYGIARVGDVAAAPDVVRGENVQSENRPIVIDRNPSVGLRGEERRARFGRQRLFLREGIARPHHLVPDGDHRIKITIPYL